MDLQYIDLHCHPAMKPYGKSFNNNPAGSNDSNPDRENSLWHYDPPSLEDKLLNYIGGLTKFSQANLTTMSYGQVSIACASIYPIEKWFVNNKLGTDVLSDVVDDFALGVGKNRIDFIQGTNDYFSDLNNEYAYYHQLHLHTVPADNDKFRYALVKNYSEIEGYRLQGEINSIHTICLIMTIEGMHALNTGLGIEPDETTILNNLAKIKAWEYKPFFVTVAHHFWNNLCGHARSLSGIVRMAADQNEKIDSEFTELGWKVVDQLLDPAGGGRIYIDIKHMSALARTQYLERLQTKYSGQPIPIIMSHAAANGLRSMQDQVIDFPVTGSLLLHEDINFYDNEILAMARSGGIMGLQLDERRIASPETLHNTPHSLFRNQIMHYRSALLWNQVQHVAELLDRNHLFAWENLAIGSDFDGIIDPLNAFWTQEEFPYLADYLERHAYNYTQDRAVKVLMPFNQISAHEIIRRIFSDNAMRFLKKFFI